MPSFCYPTTSGPDSYFALNPIRCASRWKCPEPDLSSSGHEWPSITNARPSVRPVNGVAAISSPARNPISAVTTGPNSILPQRANEPRSVFYAAAIFAVARREWRPEIRLGRERRVPFPQVSVWHAPSEQKTCPRRAVGMAPGVAPGSQLKHPPAYAGGSPGSGAGRSLRDIALRRPSPSDNPRRTADSSKRTNRTGCRGTAPVRQTAELSA